MSGPHCRTKTSLALCNSGHRSCSQHLLRYSASAASFFFFLGCFVLGLLAGARSLCRRLDGARATGPASSWPAWAAWRHPSALRAPRDCELEQLRRATANAACALAHGRGQSNARLDSLDSFDCDEAGAAARYACMLNAGQRDRAQTSRQRLVERHAARAAKLTDCKKKVSDKKAVCMAARGGERSISSKRRAGRRAPSVLGRAKPERELNRIHVDGNQSGRGARLGAAASTAPS